MFLRGSRYLSRAARPMPLRSAMFGAATAPRHQRLVFSTASSSPSPAAADAPKKACCHAPAEASQPQSTQSPTPQASPSASAATKDVSSLQFWSDRAIWGRSAYNTLHCLVRLRFILKL
jgi:hypothetical protein